MRRISLHLQCKHTHFNTWRTEQLHNMAVKTVPRAPEVAVMHTVFFQESRVQGPCETKPCWSLVKPNNTVLWLRLTMLHMLERLWVQEGFMCHTTMMQSHFSAWDGDRCVKMMVFDAVGWEWDVTVSVKNAGGGCFHLNKLVGWLAPYKAVLVCLSVCLSLFLDDNRINFCSWSIPEF